MESILLQSVSVQMLKTLIKECVEEVMGDKIKDFNPKALSKKQNLELYTRKEVNQLLQVSNVTLNAWEKKGVLVPIRIGTRVRYKVSNIELFLKRKQETL